MPCMQRYDETLRLFGENDLLDYKVVARDGIEPPTPAFSGPPSKCAKRFRINGSC